MLHPGDKSPGMAISPAKVLLPVPSSELDPVEGHQSAIVRICLCIVMGVVTLLTVTPERVLIKCGENVVRFTRQTTVLRVVATRSRA